MSLGWIGKDISRDVIEGFLSRYGRTFYKIAPLETEIASKYSIRLERKGEKIPKSIKSLDGGIEIVPFRREEEVMTLTWINQ